VTLRVDVPINEPVIYVNFVDKCSFMRNSYSLPRSTGYAVGIFFVTFIVYYVLIWIIKNRIDQKIISNVEQDFKSIFIADF
jgi:Na+-translocating ferredoxin:NAD+ oxidoreductase RnfA subunit